MLAMFSFDDLVQPDSNTQGSQTWNFSALSGTFAYLSAWESVTLTYAVEISDTAGGSTVQCVTVTVTGTNQAPVISDLATTATASLVDQAPAANSASTDLAGGVIGFTDANLDDTHTATIAGVTASGATGGIPSNATLLSLLSLGDLTEESGFKM